MINKILFVNIVSMLLFSVILAYMNYLFAERHMEDYT